jgi:hypothetical protein
MDPRLKELYRDFVALDLRHRSSHACQQRPNPSRDTVSLADSLYRNTEKQSLKCAAPLYRYMLIGDRRRSNINSICTNLDPPLLWLHITLKKLMQDL